MVAPGEAISQKVLQYYDTDFGVSSIFIFACLAPSVA
jgi:hypothetical protein